MDLVRLSATGIACVLLTAACPSPNRATGPTEVSTIAVDRRAIQQRINAGGIVQARAPVNVQPETSGRVREVAVDVGAEVHAGDVIARLQDDSARLAVNQARANVLSAQAKSSTVEAGARPDDVAQAVQALNQQQLKLAAMESQGRPDDVAAAQSAYAAQLAKLNALQRGGRPEAVQQARQPWMRRSKN
jgi:multidrug efflux pump subunit AcrA (membrane-fusion protein)